VFDALLAGGAEARGALGRAADLGLDLTAPHAVLVVEDSASHFEGPRAAALLGRLERSLQGRLGDAAVLLAVKATQLVCIFNAPDPVAVDWVTERVSQVLGTSDQRTWLGAVGRPTAGADGVRASYEQARESLELALRLRLPGPVVDTTDLRVFRVLLRDRSAINDLITSTLGPLVKARGGAGPLLETLDAYYATGGTATETARRLHLSVRAVTYRLARIHDLLGIDPTDPVERFGLQAAALAARLLDWPHRALEP
jgi:sugar diacid utilization regulator